MVTILTFVVNGWKLGSKAIKTAALNFNRAPPCRWLAWKWLEGVLDHEVRQHTDAW